ncbi:unnamed protein product [Parascedosporium putredinis]|uniref:FYVE-type domain-containing protein n=1 Tax=Parascedosporium putredinis TaxID=1442378 RepID=A0A9P1GZC3_9PEZI|nr:unnamed protein product [Parascedosporium putredinis]CAI7991656.1 unnamed protein product [Parascedosporium putredinis]
MPASSLSPPITHLPLRRASLISRKTSLHISALVTLLQLNQHLDDSHQELPEIEQDEVKTWFDKQVRKAKRFQPLSVINQKLRGLEVFESNDSDLVVASGSARGPGQQRPADSPSTRTSLLPDITGSTKRPTTFAPTPHAVAGSAPPPEHVSSGPNPILSPVATLTGQNSSRKLLEQSVVTWEEDASVAKCPFCRQDFGSWTFRRHHCRTCGRVVCADPQTGCSAEVGLNVATPVPAPGGGQLSIDVRMCRDCSRTIFAKRDFQASLTTKPPDQRAYETLRHPSHAQIKEASKIRKRLIDSFAKYDLASRRMRDLRTTSDQQLRLQKAVYAAASSFLHANMLPLKSSPSSPSPSSSHLSPLRNGGGPSSTSAVDASETASQASETSTIVSALETEEKGLRERLVVLDEQRFMVKQMVDAARDARRFEEVTALSRNLDELDEEIDRVKSMVGVVEERWQGLYASGSIS